ncbi:MAG TPA: esterase-like activity of phytase family protein [Aggregatilineaceae bacterium]|nr:esterase-like activity of phytase family protein [Aggregatilineaceae bacterium]
MRKLVMAMAIALGFSGLLGVRADGEKLIGRAVLPAQTLASGPKSGTAYNGKTINGVALPFDTQPVGNVSAVLHGDGDYWLLLTGRGYQSAGQSADFQVRLYTVTVSVCGSNCSGDQGTVSVNDWWTLADPGKKFPKALANANQPAREFTGADLDPQGLARASDGSFWIADAAGLVLLHFGAAPQTNGQSKILPLIEPPIPLGSGALQGMSGLPDGGSLVAAMLAGGQDAGVRSFDLKSKGFVERKPFHMDDPAHVIGGLTAVSNDQALVIEQDKQQGAAAKFKRIFLFNMASGAKAPLVDLLNLPDPGNISAQQAFGQSASGFGIGGMFKFPYADISSVYPVDKNTLLVVNNNHVPFDTGRTANVAEDTDFILVGLPAPLP